MPGPATLYLIPSLLGESGPNVIPDVVKQVVQALDVFIVEHPKTARHYLRAIGYDKDFDTVTMYVLDKHTEPTESYHFLDAAKEGKSIGLISEAGAPGVADPGTSMVALAHQKGIRVKPLPGPSSILLALMVSGMNGQAFRFHGYLPIDRKERIRTLKYLEGQASQGVTQIFMEAPYRNNKLLEDVMTALQPTTKLCIAANLTLPNEFVRMLSVEKWKGHIPNLHKQPAIFLIGN